MNTLKDGRYRWVLWCVVVVSSVALMPQHGEPVLTGPEFVDSLWVAGDKGLLKIDVSDASVLLEIPNMDDMRAMDIDDRRGLLWAVSKDRLFGISFGGEVLFTVPEQEENRGDDDDDDDDDDDERDDHYWRRCKAFGLQVNSTTGTVWLGLERWL